ncbi:hypothetical protein Drose_01260 [Dactylosporangium roseum]|uniref:Glycosyltransferase RgtA/B/C/D-like domain-containing protein n=1 Tax=Dactylosporangium roseum TaxID=47989 RepID=A0ABY5Z7L2_9ACTN|nr:hypothetical protein [Dactylosporangium roseum]UWZ36990.1 hypothetical protein Drose_01260 [Dactylosporangium roseum]
MTGLLALLPLATLLFTTVALHPRAEDTPREPAGTPGDRNPRDLRRTVIQATAAVCAAAIVSVEVLSLFGAIAAAPVIVLWTLATLGTGYLAWRRLPRFERPALRLGTALSVAIPLGLLVAMELVLAVASSPNNFDSNHYHLAKIEHWVANGDLGVYPTVQIQQIILVPGAEYLLLHLRLLTGGDGQFNLVQWGAGLLGAVAVARCAAQLGAGRLGQWLAAAVFLTTPAIVLESTSTQNDLVVAAWVACAATIALDGVRRRAALADVLALGATAGLVVVTKSTALMALAPVLLFWGICQLRQRAIGRTAAATLAVVALIGLLAGPALFRVHEAFGSPLGPDDYRASLSTQRHDPAAVLVNGLRLVASTLLTPVPQVNGAVGKAVVDVAHQVGVDPNDPAITHWRSVFPGTRWKPDEDRSPYPIQSALVLVAIAVSLFARPTRPYSAAVLGAFVLTAAIVKWQDWGNRLILPTFALGVPLAGYWLGRIVRRKVVAAGVVLVLAGAFAYAYTCVLLGQPRRLIGQGSVFTLDDWQERFVRMPDQAVSYRTAIDDVRASGARRVGMVMEGDLWEYPFQITLTEVELVSLESGVPTRPAPSVSSVDAVICVAPVDVCGRVVPADWRLHQIDPIVATAFPPGR